VVDDEENVRRPLGDMLEILGYQTIFCDNGEEALRYYLDDADILITDINMPRINGAELTMKAKKRKAGLPVIIMTGTIFDVPAGHLADAVIGKPFKIKNLHEIIRKLLE